MWKNRTLAILILFVGVGLSYFVTFSEPRVKLSSPWLSNIAPATSTLATLQTKYPFRLGLDLSGGTRLTYKADVSKLTGSDVTDSMDALRDVIERRVNLLGVSEPVVQTEHATLANEERLIVELPGVTDINQAIQNIGQTPTLEFKLVRPEGPEKEQITKDITAFNDAIKKGQTADLNDNVAKFLNDKNYLNFIDTGLDGRLLVKSQLAFDQNTRKPYIELSFNDAGAALFAKLTRENVGKQMYIFLDGEPISAPTIQEEITGGKATINGTFTPAEAKTLVGRLNSGALPVPIALVGSQLVGPSLGADSVQKGVHSALIAFLLIAVFLIVWYRLPGLLSVFALTLYVVAMLAVFKFIPVTLSVAGIAGFIISIGLAVDANILIFERMKEELRNGKSIRESIETGFARAWTSIRDSNIAHLISAVILFWFGTSIVKGFALTLGLGVVLSMISAITVSRIFLLAVGSNAQSKFARFLMANGFSLTRTKVATTPKN